MELLCRERKEYYSVHNGQVVKVDLVLEMNCIYKHLSCFYVCLSQKKKCQKNETNEAPVFYVTTHTANRWFIVYGLWLIVGVKVTKFA